MVKEENNVVVVHHAPVKGTCNKIYKPETEWFCKDVRAARREDMYFSCVLNI